MKLSHVLVAASLSLVAGQALAGEKKDHPNCEVAGKKKHVKDKAACEAEKGKWVEAEGKAAAGEHAAAPEHK